MSGRFWRPGAVLALIAAVVATVGLMTGPATAAPTWAPADTATIHPGVQMYTEGAQCTANFVYTDGSGAVYVGYAAHCAGTGGATETNGCDSGSLPLGTKVEFVEGGSLAGEGEVVGTGMLAYSSWLTMQQRNEQDQNTCDFNDLALVKVDQAFVDQVNPSVPHWGGPVALNTDESAQGETVYSYGNSSLRGGVEELSPKQGVSLGADSGGWNHQVYTVTPGCPATPAAGSWTPRATRWARSPPCSSPRSPGPTASATSSASWATPSSTVGSPGWRWCREPSRSPAESRSPLRLRPPGRASSRSTRRTHRCAAPPPG
jgi:hypothetical protein